MKEAKQHPRYHPVAVKLTKIVCLLNFNHALTAVEFDHKGSDFRQVDRCTCGKRKKYGHWTDDNHVQGYGTANY